jgi:putative transposase
LSELCEWVEISRSCFYYEYRDECRKSPGRPPPGHTINRDGEIIDDSVIVETLKEYRSEWEFLTSGGYQKLTSYLRIERKMYINHKKIYRLCDENNLLLFKKQGGYMFKKKKRRCEYVEVTAPNQLWQFDIKYGYVHGENRFFFVLAFLDVFTKKVVGYHIGKSCKSGDLVKTLDQALRASGIGPEHQLVIRSDNGPQMSSNKFFFHLKRIEKKLSHEFIPPRTPDRNAFVEAFFSILEREMLSDRYFSTFLDAYNAVVRFITFYNTRRLHGSLDDRNPDQFIRDWENGSVQQYSVSA